jgi:hypothetical protein
MRQVVQQPATARGANTLDVVKLPRTAQAAAEDRGNRGRSHWRDSWNLLCAMPVDRKAQSSQESPMADDKSKRGGPDQSRVAGEQAYEVKYFAQKHGISQEQAKRLIDQIGNDRQKLDQAAEKLEG